MTIDAIFNAGNLAAGTGWAALFVALFARPARGALFVCAGLILPIAFALVYLGLFVSAAMGPRMVPDFSSLGGIKALFSHDTTMTVGWYHYLAFDLTIGTWIVRDGLARGATRWLLFPILALTMMLGPIGLLAYGLLWAAALRGTSPGLPVPQAWTKNP
jgi:hypothetical protein